MNRFLDQLRNAANVMEVGAAQYRLVADWVEEACKKHPPPPEVSNMLASLLYGYEVSRKEATKPKPRTKK